MKPLHYRVSIIHFLLISSCLLGLTYAQSQDDSLFLKKLYLEEARLFRKAPSFYLAKWDSIAATVDSLQSPHAHAWTHYTLGILKGQYFQQMQEAKEEMKRALWGYTQVGDSISVGKTYAFVGSALYFLGEWEESKQNFIQSEAILTRTTDTFSLARTLMSYGALEKKRGDLGSALEVLERGAQLANSLNNTRLQSNIQVNIGACHSELGQLEAAYTLYTEALQGFEAIEDKRGQGICWLNQGRIRYKQKAYQEAENKLLRASAQLLAISQKTFYTTAQTNLAYVYRETQQWRKARAAFERALAIAQETDNQGLAHVVTRERAYLDYLTEDYTQAAQGLKDALALSTQDLVNGFPKAGDIRMPFEAIHTAHYLGRAHYGVYQENLETNALSAALNSYRLALNLIDSLRLSQSHRQSQSHIAEINDEVFAEMMDLLYLMYEKTQNPRLWEEMWYVAERNRSFQLFQSMLRIQKASSTSDAPFHQTFAPTPIADIQAQLLPDEHMLSYMYGTEKVWAMKLNAHDLKVQSVGSVESVDEGVQNMRKALTSYWEARQTCQDTSENGCDSVGATAFTQQAHNVYRQIWRPSFEENGSFPQRVIVIPHGQLHLLPFGTLLTKLPDIPDRWRTHDYLLQKYEIQQAYSARIWFVQHTHTPSKKRKWGSSLALAPFLGEAPSYLTTRSPADRAFFPSLPHSQQEIDALTSHWRVQVKTGAEAVVQSLRENQEPFQILHISSHAQVHINSSSESFIALADTLMSLTDIQLSSLRAGLVVLSACETGIGQYQKGEGVLSLGRAFHEAGATSSLTTLWQVEDAATSKIVAQFYHHLATGMDKTQALQQAQMDYITQSDRRLAHPFFWSAWVLMGDEQPIDTPPIIPAWVWILTGASILGLGWYLGRRRSKRMRT
ncbi:MAG: CHAT domain-containing tetratricopeptide repeat protein [Bacteroidota bacterium]